jgi:AcrR family transcriptional regulator
MSSRQCILDNARILFARRGYDGASVRDIARASDVNISALSYHFGSKQALFEEVIRDGTAGIRATLSDLAAKPMPLRDKARLLFDAYLEFLTGEDSVSRIIMAELAVGGRRLPEAAAHLLLQAIGVLRGMIREGVRNGEIRPDVDETLTIISIVSLPVYLAFARPVVELIRGKKGYSRAFLKKSARHAVSVLFDGIAARTPTTQEVT